ncbi:MAG: Flp pilus assembly protein CpaB [Candidatus Eremiobacteraeota bacterium]|nr:Flp pilus assembly protein CpaB [Candidatus Eremiobacteraeota bacterium]
MNTRRITLIVAVVLAIGTGILTLRYLSSLNQPKPQQAVVMQPVVVASRVIPARAKITSNMLSKTMRPAGSVDAQALPDPRSVEGDIALMEIPQGATITSTKVGQPAEAGISERLTPGMRAVSIPVDRVKAVANLVQPGDRVDVMAAVAKGSGEPPKTFTIIRGALVLAINSQLDQATASATPPPDSGTASTVTLGVTPEQADLLTVADLNATIRLALRSPQESIRSLPAEKMVFSDLGGAAPANVPPPAMPAAAPIPVAAVPVPAAVSVPAVAVIDGDKITSGAK